MAEAEDLDGDRILCTGSGSLRRRGMGKASTSTLQRRLRLGYGRAARILDMMHREGIIGPPDGSRPVKCSSAPIGCARWIMSNTGEIVRYW